MRARQYQARKQDVMRFTHCAAILITVPISGILLVATAATASAFSGPEPGRVVESCIAVSATIPVGSGPVGVSANPKSHTIYVTNFSDNTVSVISGHTNTVTATIPVGTQPNGVAANPKTHTIYVTNELGNTVSVINGNTNDVTKTIRVGSNPAAAAVIQESSTVYVTNSGPPSNSVSV